MFSKSLPIYLAIVVFFNIQTVIGQCTSCDVTINGNANPSAAITNNSVVCISGNRTSSINFRNARNVTICVANNATVNATFSSLSGLSAINNYGTITVGTNYNGNWTINNYGVLNFNSVINSNKVVNNFATMNVPGSLTVSGSLNSTGVLSIGGAVTFNSNSNLNLGAITTVGGNATINSNIGLAGSLTVAGSAQINSSGGVYSLNANQYNSLKVNGVFSSNGLISGSNLDYGGTKFSLFVTLKSGNPSPILSDGATLGSYNSADCLELIQIVNSANERDEVYIFRCSGILDLPEILKGEELIDVMALLVAGGGGGGRGTSAGGAGAGGVLFMDGLTLQSDTQYQVIVGGGGRGSSSETVQGFDGSNSSFFGLITAGGGGGGSSSASVNSGRSGGSGGGGAFNSNGLGGKPSQLVNSTGILGNFGGNGSQNGNSDNRYGGGGGGAFAEGMGGSGQNQGLGGNGINSNILDGVSLTEIVNAFGGGGGATGRNNNGNSNFQSSGGSVEGISVGGSGNSSLATSFGGNGLGNTGSGGGAGRGAGGAGGSGVVIVRVSFKILPVEFLDFQAEYLNMEKSTKLTWATAKEWENSHFEIERSIDGINDFQQVGEVQGMGWKDSITEYAFLDKDLPLTGGNMLYRLKQVDFNGKSSYSKVVSVKVSTIQSTKGVWRAYPNPTNGEQLKINLLDKSQYDEEPITFRLIHPTTVSNVVTVKSENEMNDTIGQMIGGIPKGIFVVEIRWGQKVEHIKVLKK